MGTCKKSEYIQSIKNETEANNAKTDKYETDNTSDRRRFTGKSVVVTGAAAGMGKAITLHFVKEGAAVVAVDLNENALNELISQAENVAADTNNGGRVIPLAGDISLEEVNEAMIARAIEETGKIDVLVNNAGIAGKSEPVTELTNESWEKIMKVDLYGPMYAIRAAVKAMLEQKNGGNIVTIASVAGIKGCRSSVAYSVAKHGLVGLCEHTAYTYMHKGIRSNIVCPGAIKTGMTSNPEKESKFGRERIMSGMDPDLPFGDTDDIASAVLYLASDEAKFVNGAKIVVDGGISCN